MYRLHVARDESRERFLFATMFATFGAKCARKDLEVSTKLHKVYLTYIYIVLRYILCVSYIRDLTCFKLQGLLLLKRTNIFDKIFYDSYENSRRNGRYCWMKKIESLCFVFFLWDTKARRENSPFI